MKLATVQQCLSITLKLCYFYALPPKPVQCRVSEYPMHYDHTVNSVALDQVNTSVWKLLQFLSQYDAMIG